MDVVIVVLGCGAMILGPPLAVLAWAVRRSALWLGTAVIVVVLESAWWLDVALIARDYRDLDGLVDCYPYCSREQKVAAAVLFYTPVAMAIVVACSLAVFEKMTSPSASTSNWPLPPSSISASCSVSAFNSAARLAARAS
jgi:hypothetical protein